MPELQIPGFEIIEKLGEGGMATVWKARQISLDRIVAVKILSSRIASDPSDVERFQSEARAAAKLKHPGLVQVYDANALEGTYYFVMEYIAGYTVGDWAKRKGTLSEQDTLLVAECVTDALQYAWKTQKIVHCDIKPDNVMVDSDGTVKVADLGLARSLSAVQSEQATDEIVGTPAFMSPEQCRGEPDLDCRSDMYSLGAMLYYLLTGRLLFAGNDDEKVIELQETGTVDDIVDVNPGVSHNVCWLVEKLLAKNKQDRHADWESVRKDLTRVKRGHPPAKPLPSEGKSTLRRNPVRNKIQQVRPAYMQDTEPDSFRGAKFLIAGGLVVIIGAGVLLLALQPRDPADMEPVRVRKQVSTPTTIPEEAVDREEHSAREMFEFADQWARKHPGEFERAVEKFTKVVKQTRGTKYALMAEDRIRELVSKREKRISAVLDSLEAKADRLADREKYREAAGLYANYSGPYAEETADRRKGRADALVEKARLLEEREKKRIAARKQRFEKLLEGICAALVADGVDAALARTKDSMEEFDLAKEKSSLKEIRRLLAEASRIDEKILESFREEKGREVAISLDDRQIKATILNVVDGKVHCRENLDVGASRRLSFGIDDLSAREKLGRMGNSDDPDTRIVKGVMALRMKSYEHASRFFSGLHPLLSKRLVREVNRIRNKEDEDEASKALGAIMQSLGIYAPSSETNGWLETAESVRVKPRTAERARAMVESFREKFGDTEFADEAQPVLEALSDLAISRNDAGEEKPRIARSRKLTPELKAIEDDRDAIVRLLLERNPGLSENRLDIRNETSVRYVRIRSRELEDISPLAAFSVLEHLVCECHHGKGKLKDLTPVANMGNLRVLEVRGFPVSDIAPLEGLPLERLELSGTAVRDITCLSSMQLSTLDLSGTRVFDFDPIAEQPLRMLRLNDTQVRDISFIEDMPVSHLEIRNSRVYDFDPLKALNLRYLELSGTQVRDIDFVAGMPLKDLLINGTSVKDLSPLDGMRLRRLEIAETLVKDFSAIAGLPLERLNLNKGRIRDLSPLADIPLKHLSLRETKVSNLWPISDLKLRFLDISHTEVADLSPLGDMPLVHFRCSDIDTRDFSALEGSPVRRIVVDRPEKLVRFLGTLPNLERVNHFRINPNLPIAPQVVRPSQ